jgi:hypothetical protein
MNYYYYPYQIGQWFVYDIVEIKYDDFTHTVDTSQYQIKEFYESEFLDNSNRKTLRIERYRRNKITDDWGLENIFLSNITTSTAERVEDNIRYIKLVFPVINGETWNANSLNTFPSHFYKYTKVDVPLIMYNQNYDTTLTVLQQDEETLINKDYSSEIYAKNIGIVYKKTVHIKKDLTGTITKGTDYTCILNSYGE